MCVTFVVTIDSSMVDSLLTANDIMMNVKPQKNSSIPMIQTMPDGATTRS
jgi:hypothetical protein